MDAGQRNACMDPSDASTMPFLKPVHTEGWGGGARAGPSGTWAREREGHEQLPHLTGKAWPSCTCCQGSNDGRYSARGAHVLTTQQGVHGEVACAVNDVPSSGSPACNLREAPYTRSHTCTAIPLKHKGQRAQLGCRRTGTQDKIGDRHTGMQACRHADMHTHNTGMQARRQHTGTHRHLGQERPPCVVRDGSQLAGQHGRNPNETWGGRHHLPQDGVEGANTGGAGGGRAGIGTQTTHE